MLVRTLLIHARARLSCTGTNATLVQAARLLDDGCNMLVVCDESGRIAGVLTKTDRVRQTGRCSGASCTAPVTEAMTRNLIAVDTTEPLQGVWNLMKVKGLKNIPVLDAERKPLGVLNASDILQSLLQEVRQEEGLLYEYVMGIGYR